MKKKILSLLLAIVLFIPMSIVKASDITIDQIITRLNENITSGDAFITRIGENATAEKLSTNIIRVSVPADPNDFFDNYEGNAENFKFFVEYRYEDPVLSFNDMTLFGVTNGTNSTFFDHDDLYEIDVLGEYLNYAIKDMIYVAYNIKTNNGYTYIHNFLVDTGFELENGDIVISNNPPQEITITNTVDPQELRILINLDEINMLPNEGATNNDTNTNLNDKTAYAYAFGENDYSISFLDEPDRVHNFSVSSFMDTYNYVKEHDGSEEELAGYEETFKSMQTLLKDEGNLIDMYSPHLLYASYDIEFIPNGFVFRIKMTDEMKKYDTFKFVTLNNYYTNPEIGETIEVTKEGDYLVGTLSRLGIFALVGTNTTVENPKTGVATYGTAGLIAIIALGGAYMVCKKKMSN